MKKYVLAFIAAMSVLGACASEIASDETETPTCGTLSVEVETQALSTCDLLPQPSNRRTMSSACPNCPLIWVYALNTSTANIDQMKLAAQRWNDYMGWTVVSVDNVTWRTSTADVPVGGVIFQRNNSYTMPKGIAGQTSLHGFGCNRDSITLLQTDWTTPAGQNGNRVTMAHELGHALMGGDEIHSADPNSMMYKAASTYNIEEHYRNVLADQRALARWLPPTPSDAW